jgi:ATP-dependent Clp protease protease subunit
MFKRINQGSPDYAPKSFDENFFIMFGEITSKMAERVIEWILRANLAVKKPKVLTILINSQGGDLTAAWAIIDVIRGSDIPVRIIGLGEIASAGLLIFVSGKKGMRILTDNTSIMTHQYYWGGEGKQHELVAMQKEMDLIQERLIRHFKKVTELSVDEINEFLLPPSDVYFTAKEAKELGLCDDIKTLR